MRKNEDPRLSFSTPEFRRRSGFSPTASRRTSTSRWSGPTSRSTPGRPRCSSSWRSPSTWTATRGLWTRTGSRS